MVTDLIKSHHSSNVRQPFQPGPLASNKDFPDKPNTPQWVYGRDQNVYWKQCKLSVVEKNKDGSKETTNTHNTCDGEGKVPYGTELYFSEGKVVEDA